MASTSKKLLPFFLFSIFSFSPISSRRRHYHHYHPLDPLTPSELNIIGSIILRSYAGSNHNLTFHYVGLDEPDKPDILSWLSNHNSTSNPQPRRAFVITRLNKQTHEIILDLSTKSIISDQLYSGHSYPVLTLEEQTVANELPLTHPPFLESIKVRGLNYLMWYVLATLLGDGTVNLYVRPLEGITVVVDLDKVKIKEYYDNLEVPVSKAEDTEYRLSAQKPPFGPHLNGATIMQLDGPGFVIEGHSIRSVTPSLHD
ncbi:unnamed protein product [Ilex paraguariensis]|uniref:Amine oxidase n=1 Tax=Ilex paraguariensis TaxID=185542 RepID=A0ABC8R4M7_9AQUA